MLGGREGMGFHNTVTVRSTLRKWHGVAVLALVLAAGTLTTARTLVRAQQQTIDYVFTYTEVVTTGDWSAAWTAIRDQVLPGIEAAGGTRFGIWYPLDLGETRFDRLRSNELVVVLAWRDGGSARHVYLVDSALGSLEVVESTWTRLFEPTVRPTGLTVTTGDGFYIHRFERYAAKDVDEVIRLSVGAWKTFEPIYGSEVVALFRERPDREGIAQTVRIAWYKDYSAWVYSRNPDLDPESEKFFQKRYRYLIDHYPYAAGLVER